MITSFARSDKNNIIILHGDRPSFRCRQRSILSNGNKIKPLRFVSFKETQQMIHKNKKRVIDLSFSTLFLNYKFDSIYFYFLICYLLPTDSVVIILSVILSYLLEQISFHISLLHILLFIHLFGLYYFLKNISVSIQIKYNV